ncbi:MAG TPA: carboxypeptidase regulatory-like domain-containing protein [Pyrinomonadaceae bacterium]|nr:carboxypeptidase regulatory-like domain-containing protein [Pyrinomonadaceae bacterium]
MRFARGLRYILLISLFLSVAPSHFAQSADKQKSAAGGVVTVTAPNAQGSNGSNIFVNISASDTTGQGITGFDARIRFNPAIVTFLGCSTTGTVFTSATVTCNLFPTPDVIAITMSQIPPVTGPGSILRLNFQVVGTFPQSSPLEFVLFTFNEGDPASTTVNGSIIVLGPTAANASISGVVRNADGRAIARARISIVDGNGFVRTAISNTFGYFTLYEVPAGQSYVLEVSAKGQTFPAQNISVVDNISGLVITAEP